MDTLSVPKAEEREKERELINIVLQFSKEDKEIMLMCANVLRARDNYEKGMP